MLPAQIKKKKMIETTSKTFSPEKVFRQTGRYGQFAHLMYSFLLSG